MAINRNLTIVAGDTKYIHVTVRNSDGTMKNLSQAKIQWSVKNSLTSTSNLIYKDTDNLGIEIEDVLEGKFLILLSELDTINMSGTFYHVAKVTDSIGSVSTIFQGKLYIKKAVIGTGVPIDNNSNITNSTINGYINVDGANIQVYNDNDLRNKINLIESQSGHVHENKTQLDRLGVNVNGELTIDGVKIQTGSTTAPTKVEDSMINGNIRVNDIEINVYNDLTLKNNILGIDGRVIELDDRLSSTEHNVILMDGDMTSVENRMTTAEGEIINTKNRVTSTEINISYIQADIQNVRENMNAYENTFSDIYNDIGEVEVDMQFKADVEHNHTLNQMSDIDYTTKANGYVLTFDSTLNKTLFKPLPSGSGSGATNLDGLTDVDVSTTVPTHGDVLTFADGIWKPKFGSSLGSYTLDLSRWGVANNAVNFTNKTEATNTSNGINFALSWASGQGFSEVILPKGTYLIDEAIPVKIPSFMTLNLNGSKLRIRDNGLYGYAIIEFDEVNFSRITNGVLEGDKDTHDYSSGGTHEGGYGVKTIGSTWISVDNCDIYNFTGDSCVSFVKGGSVSFNMSQSTLQLGSYDLATGLPKEQSNRIRCTSKLDLSNTFLVNRGYFTLSGNGYGYLGLQVTATHYDVIFYNADDTFHSSKGNVELFSVVEIPNGAKWAKFTIHQAIIPSDGTTIVNDVEKIHNGLTVWYSKHCQYLFYEKNNCHHNRRQGMSLVGRYIYIRDNRIHHIKGTAPQGGIDIEDGYDLNQYYFIERNYFHDNASYDLVVINGRHIKISQNKFESTEGLQLVINDPTDKVLISGNSFHQGLNAISGEHIFTDNWVFGCNMQFKSVDGKSRKSVIGNSVFYNSYTWFNYDHPYMTTVSNCLFYNDDKKIISHIDKSYSIGISKEPQTFSSCTFEGTDTTSFFYMYLEQKNGWIFDNVLFKDINTSSLPSGMYSNCNFINPKALTFNMTNLEYTFISSKFKTSQSLVLFAVDGVKSFRILNSDIEHVNNRILKINNVTDEVVVKSNKISYPTGSDSISAIKVDSTFIGNSILIESNQISSLNNRVAFENLSLQPNIIVRDNTLTNTTLNSINKEVFLNNIIDRVIDPYYRASAEPTSGFYTSGREIKNTGTLTSGSYLGWVCTTEGFAETNTWAISTLYNVGNRITANGHVYEAQNHGRSTKIAPTFPTNSGETVEDKVGTSIWQANTSYSIGDYIVPTISNGSYYECITAGTSDTIEPTWSTTIGDNMNDGTTLVWKCVRPIIVWKEIGNKAVFRQYGLIS